MDACDAERVRRNRCLMACRCDSVRITTCVDMSAFQTGNTGLSLHRQGIAYVHVCTQNWIVMSLVGVH